MKQAKEIAITLLGGYIRHVERFKKLIIVLFVLLSAVAVHYTINNLQMNTDTRDMLSAELDWRKLDIDYESNFPHVIDNILVVIEADTPDQAADTAALLHARLLAETGSFKTLYYPRSLSLFRQNGLLFLDTQELQQITDNLVTMRPLLAKLASDNTLRGLFGMLSDALAAIEAGHDIQLQPLILQLDLAINHHLQGKPFRVSWQQLLDGNTNADNKTYREYLFLQPVMDFNSLFPAESAINRIRELAAEISAAEQGTRIHLTGTAMLAHEEFVNVSQGTGLAVILSLCAVALIMILGLRSIRLVIFTLITLFTGLLLTAGFATLAIGELNLISVAFAVLYIGLGVDFAIHYCLRYRELMTQKTVDNDALVAASTNVGSSLFICSVTTAIGFFAFIPTDYQGVAELGLISGTGMFISLFVTLTLLPALLALMPLKPVHQQVKKTGLVLPWQLLTFPLTHSRTIIILASLLILVFAWLLQQVRFDYNILNLQNAENESVKTYTELLADPDTSPWTGIIVADNRDDAILTSARLENLAVIDRIVWLDNFIPDNQAEKIELIDNLRRLLTGGFAEPGPSPLLPAQVQLQALTEFLQGQADSDAALNHPYLQGFFSSLSSYVNQVSRLDADEQARSLHALSASMLAALPGRLQSLNASLRADYITADSLPDSFRQQWITSDDRYLLQIFPTEDLNDNNAMRLFVQQIQAVDPRITGAPVVNIEAGDAVMAAFREAFTWSFCAITLLLLVLLPRKRDTLYVLTPLLFAVIMTGGFSVLLDIPLNFANIIALPLLLGIGVDSSIHILHRFRTALPDHNNILATSTAKAVVVSSLTTMGSIGNLAFSPHTGTASMGMLLTTGIAMTLLATLVLLPSLLAQQLSDNTTNKS